MKLKKAVIKTMSRDDLKAVVDSLDITSVDRRDRGSMAKSVGKRQDIDAEYLLGVLSEVQAGRQEDDSGLDPETQAPFMGVLRQEMGEVSPEALHDLAQIAIDMVEHIQQEIRLVGFWKKTQAQDALRNWIVQFLDDQDILDYDRLPQVADRLVELAKANQHKLVK